VTPTDVPPPDYTPHLTQVDEPADAGRIVLRIVLGLVVTSLLIGAYFYFGQRKVVATGSVTRISLYPIHSVMGDNTSAPGMAGQTETYDQLILFTQLRVHNQSDTPLTITEMVSNIVLTAPDQNGSTEPSSRAVDAGDFNRLFSAYPKLASFRADPLLRDTVIAPNADAEGLVVFSYSLSKDQWEQRKSFGVAVSFTNGTVIHIETTHP